MNEFDKDKDGIVSEADERIIELENKDKKEDQMRKMAWLAMLSVIALILLLLLPIVPETRVDSLEGLLTTFFIAQAGVVAAFFGSSAYMTVNRT